MSSAGEVCLRSSSRRSLGEPTWKGTVRARRPDQMSPRRRSPEARSFATRSRRARRRRARTPRGLARRSRRRARGECTLTVCLGESELGERLAEQPAERFESLRGAADDGEHEREPVARGVVPPIRGCRRRRSRSGIICIGAWIDREAIDRGAVSSAPGDRVVPCAARRRG